MTAQRRSEREVTRTLRLDRAARWRRRAAPCGAGGGAGVRRRARRRGALDARERLQPRPLSRRAPARRARAAGRTGAAGPEFPGPHGSACHGLAAGSARGALHTSPATGSGRNRGVAADHIRHRRRAARGACRRDPRTCAPRTGDPDHGDDARRSGRRAGADPRPRRGRHGSHARQLRPRRPRDLGANGQAPAPGRTQDRQALRIVLRPGRTEASHRPDRGRDPRSPSGSRCATGSDE